MKGHGISHGAATIVSAFATGKGAAFGIDLTTTADVTLEEGSGIEVAINGFPGESPALAHECARAILERYAEGRDYHVRIATSSQIPVSRGLKSSSAAANAIIAAMLDAAAFDDACAAWFGGVVLTDNTSDTILSRDTMPDDVVVFIHVPERQIRKSALPGERIAAVRDIVDVAFDLAEKGDYYRALTLNGMCYSAALGLDTDIAVRALQNGALAAGLTGSGPATVMLVERSEAGDFEREMDGCTLMRASINNGRSIE